MKISLLCKNRTAVFCCSFLPNIHECSYVQLNPALLDGATDSKTNTEILLSLLNTMLEDIFRAVDFCPV